MPGHPRRVGSGINILSHPFDDSASPVKESTLPNGLSVLSQTVPYVRTVSVGMWIGSGSRHESPEEAGASHFIEHLLFKGTQRRSALDISEAVDWMGGYMNAYTAKEYTCLYARVPQEHLPETVDLLADMLLNSKFDPRDVERERQVILEEIAGYEDNPEGIVHDLFYDTLWPNHPLGRPILGTPETIGGLDRDSLVRFFERRYGPGRIVLSAVGNMEHDEIVSLVEGLLGRWQGREDAPSNISPTPASGDALCHRDTEQIHMCLGFPGVRLGDPNSYPLTLLAEIAGGGSSSRLFQKVREDMGLVYSIYTTCGQYSDGGSFLAYAGTSPNHLEQVTELIIQELTSLKEKGVSSRELDRAKAQIRGGLLLSLESTSARMGRIGKTKLLMGRVVTTEEVADRIQSIHVEEVNRVAEKALSRQLARATLGPLAPGEGNRG